MPITIHVSAGAKRSHPTEPYGSLSANVELSGEAGVLDDVTPIVRLLLTTAQTGCDLHLAAQVAALTGASVQQQPVRSAPPLHNSIQSQGASRSPNHSRSAPRRGIPPISDAQKRLLERLLNGDSQRTDEVCQRAGVATIGALNMKQASEAIDTLKTSVPA